MNAKSKKPAPKKSPKIPRVFRKPLKKKRFEKLTKMLIDAGEKKKMETVFPEGPDGRRRYKAPTDKKKAKEIAGILKKVRKARSGPRTFRLVLVLILIVGPIFFNLFFLDGMVSRRLEKILEEQTGTDATVNGLDIAPLKASVRLGKLALASQTDPMVDDWVLENLAADVRWSSLFYRRAVIDEISAEFAVKVPRETAAVYPEESEGESNEKEGEGLNFDSDWLPSVDIQFASSDLVQSLREDVEAEYKALTEGLDEDINEAREVGEDVTELLGRSLPGKTDIAGWTALVKDGKELSEDLKAQSQTIEEYRARLVHASSSAKEASEEARRAVEADLAKIEDAVSFDSSTLNGLLESAVGSYLGPKAEALFAKINTLRSKIGTSGDEQKSKGLRRNKREKKGRMKSGRIVSFPVRLPPRFTIGKMHFSGLGAELNGTNVGIDHDLAGAPSVLDLEIDGMSGFDGFLSADICADGRTGAENILLGNASTSGWQWSTGRGSEDLGGNVEATAEFYMNADNPDKFIAAGEAVFSNWNGSLGSGSVDVVSADSPPLALDYEIVVEKGVPSLKLSLAEGMFETWSKKLAESLLPLGTEEAKAALMDAVGSDLDGLDEVLENLDAENVNLNEISSVLGSQQQELADALEEWTKEATGGVEIPGVDDAADDVLENAAKGLKSLF